MFVDLLSAHPNSNKTAKKRVFLKKLTFQELDVTKLQIFSWLLTFLPYKMLPTINELKVELAKNNLGQMQ